MFDLWFGLPRWVRALAGLVVLAYPAYLLFRGIVWPWGLAAGGCLLVLALPKPLGPPPSRSRPPW